MPIYGYRCDKCGNELEVLQSFSDERLTECPKCGGRLHKKLYPAGVIYKGSGFYKTDYSSTSKESKGKSDGSSESKSDSGKSESSSGSGSDTSSDGSKAAAS